MRIYAVLDTNVLVSALLKWDSVPGNILEFAYSGVIIPVYNDDILGEYRQVLSRERFHFPPELVEDVLAEMIEQGENINAEHLDIYLPDPKDVVFYEVVMEKGKTDDAYLVTGNVKHFPSEKHVVTPREMLDIILHKQ